jgi:hypothetical protein
MLKRHEIEILLRAGHCSIRGGRDSSSALDGYSTGAKLGHSGACQTLRRGPNTALRPKSSCLRSVHSPALC